MSEKPLLRPGSYLSPPDLHRLSWACRPIREAFPTYGVYLVGSVLERLDFRDIDLRLILPDKRFRRLVSNERVGLLLNIALSDLIAGAAGLPWPIDFQIQSMTEANGPEYEGRMRNPMGLGLP